LTGKSENIALFAAAPDLLLCNFPPPVFMMPQRAWMTIKSTSQGMDESEGKFIGVHGSRARAPLKAPKSRHCRQTPFSARSCRRVLHTQDNFYWDTPRINPPKTRVDFFTCYREVLTLTVRVLSDYPFQAWSN